MKEDRYRNRRRMAWISFLFMLIVSAWMIYRGVSVDGAAERVEKLSFLLGTVFGMCTSIVISYFTATTITDVKDLQFQPPKPGEEGK